MLTNECRPAGAASEAWRPENRVPSAADIRAHLEALDTGEALCALTHGAIWRAGYAAGRADEAAARAAEEEREREAAHRRHAAFLARLTPYDELADRRGEHNRAEAHRRLLADRGIA